MNDRRKLIVALGMSALAAPLALFSQQQGKVPRIGFLIAETLSGQANRIEALRTGPRKAQKEEAAPEPKAKK